MGGNGTFAAGNVAKYRWETVGTVHGVKVLALRDRGLSRKLPEEAHSSRMYIQQHPDGSFSQLRIYDRFHRLRFEVGYHREPQLDESGKAVLHYHVYTYPSGSSRFKRTEAKRITERMWKRLRRFMKGARFNEERQHARIP